MSAAQAPGGPVAVEAPVAAPAAAEVDAGGELDVGALREAAAAALAGEGAPAVEPEKPAAAEPEKPKLGDEIDLSRKWAKHDRERGKLAKEKKEFQVQAEEFKAKYADFEKKSADLEVAYSDPIAFLGKAGWDKERIMQWVMGDGKVDPELLVKQLETRHQEEIRKLREERDQEKKELESARTKRELERVEGELYSEVSTLLKDSKFELLQKLVAKNPKQEAVLQKRVGSIIAEVYKKTSGETVVDPADALLYLQSELAEIQLADPAPSPAVKSAKSAAVEPRPITNSSTSERVVQRVDYDEMDPEQRKERAAAILRGDIEPDEE